MFDWISHDTHLSKYLVIFILSPKMNVILVDFSQEIVWPEATKKWPHWLQWRAEFSGMWHSSGFSVPPSGWSRKGWTFRVFIPFLDVMMSLMYDITIDVTESSVLQGFPARRTIIHNNWVPSQHYYTYVAVASFGSWPNPDQSHWTFLEYSVWIKWTQTIHRLLATGMTCLC